LLEHLLLIWKGHGLNRAPYLEYAIVIIFHCHLMEIPQLRRPYCFHLFTLNYPPPVCFLRLQFQTHLNVCFMRKDSV